MAILQQPQDMAVVNRLTHLRREILKSDDSHFQKQSSQSLDKRVLQNSMGTAMPGNSDRQGMIRVAGDNYQHAGEDAGRMPRSDAHCRPFNKDDSGTDLHIRMLYTTAEDLLHKGKTREGLKVLSRLLELEPHHGDTLRLMIALYFELGEPEKAGLLQKTLDSR
jgi:hypothetical protein